VVNFVTVFVNSTEFVGILSFR